MNLDELLERVYDTNDSNFEMWSGHRQTLSSIIDRRVKQKLDSTNDKSIAIWGAGKCYDIDLTYLCNNFKKVTLLDINKDIVTDALNMQNVSNKKNIEIIEVDFLNNTYEIYNNFFNLLKRNPTINEIEIFLENMKADIINYDEVCEKLDKYDVSVCLGVHSQLLGAISAMLLALQGFYSENDISKLLRIFYRCQGQAARKLNKLIMNHSCSLLLMGFDLMELSYKNGTMNLYSHIQNELYNNKVFDVISFAMQHPISGAADAMEHIKENVIDKKLDVGPLNCWIWEYDNSKKYVFVLETLKISQKKL